MTLVHSLRSLSLFLCLCCQQISSHFSALMKMRNCLSSLSRLLSPLPSPRAKTDCHNYGRETHSPAHSAFITHSLTFGGGLTDCPSFWARTQTTKRRTAKKKKAIAAGGGGSGRVDRQRARAATAPAAAFAGRFEEEGGVELEVGRAGGANEQR